MTQLLQPESITTIVLVLVVLVLVLLVVALLALERGRRTTRALDELNRATHERFLATDLRFDHLQSLVDRVSEEQRWLELTTLVEVDLREGRITPDEAVRLRRVLRETAPTASEKADEEQV